MSAQEELRRRIQLILQIARERLTLDPNDADALFALAAVQATLNEAAGGIQTLDRLAEIQPNYPGLWVLKAKLHARLGQEDLAQQSRIRGSQESQGPAKAADLTVPCPMCDVPVALDATTCANCGAQFASPPTLEDELDDLGHAAVQDMVQEELQAGPAPPPGESSGPPTPSEGTEPAERKKKRAYGKRATTVASQEGLTNGLVLERRRGRKSGMTNGLADDRGRTNGLTNGVGRTNGLTNGLGRTNGLTNGVGRTNGITNGVGRTNGLTNGLGGIRPAGFHAVGLRGMMQTAGWKLYLIPVVAVALLLVPLLNTPAYPGSMHPIQIDGVFDDWRAVSKLDATSGSVPNANVDVIRFGAVDNVGPFAFYVQVRGTALQGGGASPGTMDTVWIFIDTDASPATGYQIDGLGADRMIEVSGYGGVVLSSVLWEFDANRDVRDWNGWIKGTGTPAAASGSQIEAEAEWVTQGSQPSPVVASVRTESWDGETDTGDVPISTGGGTLLVTGYPQVPAVIAGADVPLVQLSLAAYRESVPIDSLRVQIVGTAPVGLASSLRLLDGSGSVISYVTPTSRTVAFTFPTQTIPVGTSSIFRVVGDFAAGGGETYGIRPSPSQSSPPGGGILTVQEQPGPRSLGYVGVAPTSPQVDGAFGEWAAANVDPMGDVSPRNNPAIDLVRFGSRKVNATTYLYADVTGRILAGTPVPQAPRPTPPPGPPPANDTDRDGVPDSVDPFPYDFNNDGIPDAATNGDYDGDGITDYGFPGGTDYWLNTTIPSTFPAPYAGRSVSVYIGPTNKPPVIGDDVLRVFLDLDNSTGTGYSIGGIGADRLVEIRGKDGAVTQTGSLAFAGSFPGQWSWTPIGPVTVAVAGHELELSVATTPASVYFEAGDFWGDVDTTVAGPALSSVLNFALHSFGSPQNSFVVAAASSALSVPWQQVGPQTRALIDPGSNAATTPYNHQRKVVRAGDTPGTACDATNSDGCWYTVFYDQFAEQSTSGPPQGPNIQSGLATLAAGSSTVSVTISSVVTTHAFLTFGASFSDDNPGFSQISGQVIDATTIRFQRATSTAAPAITIKWYVAEFSRGVTVQRGSAAMTATSLTVSISSVSLTDSFPLVTYRKSGTTYIGDNFVKAKITSSTNLQLSLVWIGSPADGVCEWQVVEYTDASVQTGDVSFASNQASAPVTIPAVDETKAWLLFSYTAANGSFANIGQRMVRGLIVNPVTLVFDRVGVFLTINLTWYLIVFADTASVQSWTVSFATSDTQKDVAISCVDLTKAIVTAGGMYYRGGNTFFSGDNPGVATFTLDLTTSTNLRISRGATNYSTDVGYFVVEFGTGCVVSGTFPNDVQSEDGVFIQYREANIGQTATANNPTGVGTSPACQWTNCANGETSDNSYAVSPSDGQIVSYKSFGFNVPAGSTISRVRFGVEVFQTGEFNDHLDQMGLSWDGTNYCTNTFNIIPPGPDPNAYFYWDQTTCGGHTWSASDFTGDRIAWQGVHAKQAAANPLDIDAMIVEVAYTPPSDQLAVRYDWSGIPAGADAYTLKVKGYRQDEDVNVQVLTPPSTWNTRRTISATANTMYTYALTTGEFNSGAPSVRFVDAGGPDASPSDLWLDLAAITSTTLWDRIVLMRSLDTSGATWGSPIVLASGRPGDSPLLSSYDSAEPSIAIDSGGFLHVVWVSGGATGNQQILNLVRYTKTTASYPTQSQLGSSVNWVPVAAVDDSAVGYMPTVSTDTSNYAHVAWSGSKTIGTVYYKNQAGGTWRSTVSWGVAYTGLSVDVSPQNNYVSLARYFEFATNEIQYLVCKDLSTSHCDTAANFTKWNGVAGVDTVATGVESASYPSLATTYDMNGDLWIAYAKDVNGTTRGIFARFLDYPITGWAIAETVASVSGTIFSRPTIGIDAGNNVHALYVDTSVPQLYYKSRIGSWGPATAVDAASDNPTLVVRAPNNATYGTAVGGIYWKTTTTETYFYYVPEFDNAVVPILAVLLGVLFVRWRRTARLRPI